MANGSLIKVKSIAECSKGSILQYFWPALSNNWSWKKFSLLFEWLLKTGFLVYPWSQWSRSSILKSYLTTLNVNSSFISDGGCSYLGQWLLMVCRWQRRFISPIWPTLSANSLFHFLVSRQWLLLVSRWQRGFQITKITWSQRSIV